VIAWAPLPVGEFQRIKKSEFMVRQSELPCSRGFSFQQVLENRYWTPQATTAALKESLERAFETLKAEQDDDAVLYLLIDAQGFGNYFTDDQGCPFFHRELVELLYQKMVEFEAANSHCISVKIFLNSSFGFSMSQINRVFGPSSKQTSRKTLEVFAASQSRTVAHGEDFWEQMRFFFLFHADFAVPAFSQLPLEAFLSLPSLNHFEYFHSALGPSPTAESQLKEAVSLALGELILILKGAHPAIQGRAEMAAFLLGATQGSQALEAADALLRTGTKIMNEIGNRTPANGGRLSDFFRSKLIYAIITSLSHLYATQIEGVLPRELIALLNRTIAVPFWGSNLDAALQTVLRFDQVPSSSSVLWHCMDGYFPSVTGSDVPDLVFAHLSEAHISRLGRNLESPDFYEENQIFSLRVFALSHHPAAFSWIRLAIDARYRISVQLAAIHAMRQQRSPAAQAELVALSQSKDHPLSVRIAAIRSLSTFDSPEVIEFLRSFSMEGDEEMRNEAMSVLEFFRLSDPAST